MATTHVHTYSVLYVNREESSVALAYAPGNDPESGLTGAESIAAGSIGEAVEIACRGFGVDEGDEFVVVEDGGPVYLYIADEGFGVGRKPHVRGPSQERLLADLRETGGGELPLIAQHYGVSEATIRRSADGLVHQGKLRVEAGRRGAGAWLPRFYETTGPRRESKPGA